MKPMNIKTILAMLVAVMGIHCALAQQPHVYINPGHGGHDADDRNVVVPPFEHGDTMGFWESNSNLWKGFALQEMLKKKGYKTSISRIRNRTADDLNLSTIVALCNSSGADVFYSIHSNATGAGEHYRINFPLGLYRGYTGSPVVPGSDQLAKDLGVYLLANQSTVWSENNYRIAGDWTFYPEWNNQGLGVLRGNNAVSMLDEGSFHDYYPETYRLINHDYDWVEGFNFSLGADRFFGRLENYSDDLEGIVTGNLRDDRLLRDVTWVLLGDDKRQPINGATVRLLDEEGNEVQTTTTDNIENGIYLFKYVRPGNYSVEVSHPEHFSQTKQVVVTSNAPTYCNFDLKRVRNTPPEVLSYSPVWSEGDPAELCVEPIVLQFNWDMDIEATEAALEIEPAVEGSFRWEDTNYRLVFTPNDAYQTNTLYTVTLHKSACHGGGTPMEQDFTFQFMTQSRSHLNTLALWPRNNCQVHYKTPNVEFRTDSLLQAKDLFNLFHVYDKNGTELEWSKRQIKNNKRGDNYGYIRLPLLHDLVPGDEYSVKIEREVSDTAGIHLPVEMSYKFVAADMGVEKPETELLYDGEDASGVTVSGTYKSASVSTSSTHLFGSKSLQVKWDFTDDSDTEVEPDLWLGMVSDQVFSAGDTLCVHVWGDMSCNKLQAVFLPTSDGDTPALPGIDLFDVCTLDFHGWQYIQMVVPYGYSKFSGFNMAPIDKRMGVSGTLLIDNVLYKKGMPNSGIDRVTLDNVQVGPVPASDYIVASADTRIQGVELLDLGGKAVVRNATNYVNVADIPAGVYLLRVYVNGLVSTHKVAVKH